MRVFQEPFEQLNIYRQIKDWLAAGDGFVEVIGSSMEGTDRVFLMNAVSDESSVKLVLTYSDKRAEQLYSDLSLIHIRRCRRIERCRSRWAPYK